MSDNRIQPRGLRDITVETDSRDILAHASQVARRNKYDEFLIVDIDAHVGETAFWPEIIDRVESPVIQQMARSFKDRGGSPPGLLNAQPGMSYQDVFGRIPHQQKLGEKIDDDSSHRQVALARRAMQAMSIDYMVLFPTPMLLLGTHPQADVEAALGHAFNRWLIEQVLTADKRMLGLMYLPFNSPKDCERVVAECADKPGVVGFSVTSTRYRAVHDDAYMRLYAMIEETGKPLAFHSGFSWQDQSMIQLNRFLSMHALSFVHFNMIHMTNWVINGLPERFPKLNVIWVESGLAWLPYLMQRLDSEYMMRSSEAPLLKKRPSEYITDMYYTSQPLECQHPKLLEATLEAIKAETQLLFSSDWPHWDFDTPSSVYDLPCLSEKAKRNILGANAAKLLGLKDPYSARAAAE